MRCGKQIRQCVYGVVFNGLGAHSMKCVCRHDTCKHTLTQDGKKMLKSCFASWGKEGKARGKCVSMKQTEKKR